MSTSDGGTVFANGSMTLRDLFAAKALSGWSEAHHGMTECAKTTWGPSHQYGPKEMAETCYRIADAMLAAREARP